ncbi:MAG: hypothetical protein CMO80_16535 [Verrucomicrobiales bacterium]|nr:hypothetical protein [Verrucomicrobiales bacterium]|tara:strand:+ start:6023 stop:7084 length:1062 start_codon:yes stop_codon:yes gene_type:complete
MSKLTTKLRFYLSLYLSRAGVRNGRFTELSGRLESPDAYGSKGRRVFFWTPSATAGARVIVHDVLPGIISKVNDLGLDWEVSAGATVPDGKLDDLICFKAVPDADQRTRSGRVVMLICDQADAYWPHLSSYDALVATSSHPFAQLVALRNPNTFYIGESEPPELVDAGVDLLKDIDFTPRRHLVWHGGAYSLGALRDLQPVLSKMDFGSDAALRIVSGTGPERSEQWGRLKVDYIPWAVESLQRVAATARLGLVPARPSLKNSWLKPASRVRRLFGMGVPAIGDGRVPDVKKFMEHFDGPLAANTTQWASTIKQLWNSPETLANLAKAGHEVVKEHYTTRRTAVQWLNFLRQG